MAWSMKAEGETVNDGGRKLKIGTFPYQVITTNMAVVKSDPSGKTQQVVIGLRNGDSYDCKCYLSVMADNDQQREIAEKTLRAIVQAAGITGLYKLNKEKAYQMAKFRAKTSSGNLDLAIAQIFHNVGDINDLDFFKKKLQARNKNNKIELLKTYLKMLTRCNDFCNWITK